MNCNSYWRTGSFILLSFILPVGSSGVVVGFVESQRNLFVSRYAFQIRDVCRMSLSYVMARAMLVWLLCWPVNLLSVELESAIKYTHVPNKVLCFLVGEKSYKETKITIFSVPVLLYQRCHVRCSAKLFSSMIILLFLPQVKVRNLFYLNPRAAQYHNHAHLAVIFHGSHYRHKFRDKIYFVKSRWYGSHQAFTLWEQLSKEQFASNLPAQLSMVEPSGSVIHHKWLEPRAHFFPGSPCECFDMLWILTKLCRCCRCHLVTKVHKE